MYDVGGMVIYVGKVKDLKKWFFSYFCSNFVLCKIEVLVV